MPARRCGAGAPASRLRRRAPQQHQALARGRRPRARRAAPPPRSRSPRQPSRAASTSGTRGRRPGSRAESPAMIVLGVDPGLASTGYGVVERRGGPAAGARRGRDRDRRRARQERRLASIHAAVEGCSRSTSRRRWRSSSCISGRTCAPPSPSGRPAGSVMLAAGQRGLDCFGYTPQQVKGAVCGNGRAPKEQVARMVAALLGAERAAAPRPRRRRARGRRLPRQPRAAGARRWPRGRGGAVIDSAAGELRCAAPTTS